MDKIIIKQMQFYGYHGLFPEENKLGQRFNVDLELHVPLDKAGKFDDMNESIHYGQAYETVKKVVEGQPFKLIEAVAEEISKELFASFPLLNACIVKVVKPDPPIPGHYKSVAVEIYRERIR
ncbi:dihydroneopterin aldolase [Oceanobacillus sp. 1P07AA]|uniref:dihydroneopterin aldolase n=1 Tax=Oceanobacillus sp. 1P07AA TaxID=3132293 RepID=UPI0039A42B2D